MFLPGSRSDVPFAGTSATTLDTGGIMSHVDGLPVRIDVERLGSGLAPAGAGVLLPSERDVRLEAVGRPVHLDAARDDPADELLAAVDAARPDRSREAVRARVRRRDRFLEGGDAVQRRDRP